MKKKDRLRDLSPVDIHLVLTFEWYDMIDKGDKREEYREIKDYYKRLFLRNYENVKDSNCQWMFLYRNIRSVIFHRGYTSTTMRWHVPYIGVGYGKPKWGAPYHPVFVIGLGKRYVRGYKNAQRQPTFCDTRPPDEVFNECSNVAI